jgi:arylsulfatase
MLGCDRGADEPHGLAELLPVDPDLNVLVVSFDALRADVLGAYGSELGASPNLDALAAESLVFDNAYTSGVATVASFGAVFSGRLPVHALRHDQPVAEVSLAEVFASAGFATAGFLNNPWTQRFSRGFAHFKGRFAGGTDEATLKAATRWLATTTGRRFFAWIHFINPHSPYDWRDVSASFYTPNYVGRFWRTSASFLDGVLDPRAHQRLWELYVGEVYFADGLFGQLQQRLSDLGLLDRTLLVVTADHGEAFAEHGGYAHNQLYEEVVRIPLLMRHPRGAAARVAAPVMNLDLLPTLASLVGIEPPEGLYGHDLIRSLDPDRPVVVMNTTNPPMFAMGIRRGPDKLILRCNLADARGRELFDLDADPQERRNRIESDPETAAALVAQLRDAVGGLPCPSIKASAAGTSGTEGLDPETRERLRKLGYLETAE